MGLTVTVGILLSLEGQRYRKERESVKRRLQFINKILKQHRLPEHVEPEDVRPWSCDMVGYDGLHFLRRIAACLAMYDRLPDPTTRQELGEKNVLDEDKYLEKLAGSSAAKAPPFCHLIVHTDIDGFYLPIDSNQVIVEEIGRGKMECVGSCKRLLKECQSLAKTLQIPSDLDPNSKEVKKAMKAQAFKAKSCPAVSDELWKAYGIETYTCLQLLEACRQALSSRCAIVFH